MEVFHSRRDITGEDGYSFEAGYVFLLYRSFIAFTAEEIAW